MKSLINIIQEKLKINSNSKITDDISDWFIAIIRGNISKERELKKKFKDLEYSPFNMSINGGIYEVFIIQPNQLGKLIDDPNLLLYKIPKNFEDIDDFEMTLIKKESPDFDWDELKDWTPEK